jgi:hypothetical protein
LSRTGIGERSKAGAMIRGEFSFKKDDIELLRASFALSFVTSRAGRWS